MFVIVFSEAVWFWLRSPASVSRLGVLGLVPGAKPNSEIGVGPLLDTGGTPVTTWPLKVI